MIPCAQPISLVSSMKDSRVRETVIRGNIQPETVLKRQSHLGNPHIIFSGYVPGIAVRRDADRSESRVIASRFFGLHHGIMVINY